MATIILIWDNQDVYESLISVERNCGRDTRLPSLPFRIIGLEQVEVSLPLVPNDLAAGEAADGYDHFILIAF